MEQWKVQRTSCKCGGTEKELLPGEEIYAALVETEEGFERIDFCKEFWEAAPPQVYCYWKYKIPVKEEKQKLLVDNNVLTNVFLRLAGEDQEKKINFRFVLALILMRKRILKYDTTVIQDEKEIWKMKMVKDPNLHDVVNPHMDDEKIQEVSHELSSILNGDFD